MEQYSGTIGDQLDRLEVWAGKIGMNSREQAYALLRGLDDAYRGLQDIENEQSRKVTEAQFSGIVAKMQREAGLMLRDLGGRAALAEERARVQPPGEHAWWHLDEYLDRSRKSALRRWLVIGGIIIAALAILAVVYQFFLAPDPQVAARYRHVQFAQDTLIQGDYARGLAEIEQGLVVAPRDPELLTLKGVLLELSGEAAAAQATFTEAARLFERAEDFYMARGQSYAMANQPEKALADAEEALRRNPDLAEAYLLSGQAHELMRMVQEALADYDLAYVTAEATDKGQLAALARMRMAMLMQSMNSQGLPTLPVETETP